jgi:hypothetical protein
MSNRTVNGEWTDQVARRLGDAERFESKVAVACRATHCAPENPLVAVGAIPRFAAHPMDVHRTGAGGISVRGNPSISPSFHPNSALPRILEPAATVRLPAFTSPMSVPDSLNSTRDLATI